MKRLILLALVAVPAFARVLSYAPYSNQPTRVGVHERSTRRFVVMEGPHEYFDRRNEVVLYDSAGIEEPRVVYPLSGTTAVDQAALYEPKGSAGPWLLVNGSAKTFLSVDGGATWKQIAIDNYAINDTVDVDFGGPFVQGLSAQILPGTDAYPFVLAQYGGVYAISATGTAKPLYLTGNGWPRLAGRNAAGDRFLLSTPTGEIRMVDFDGHSTVLATLDPNSQYTGWITSDGSAYIQNRRADGRFLYFWRNGQLQFLLGPYDAPAPLAPPVQSFDPMRFFAVPTHDFNGAWMIQREAGKPTTLLRHSAARGIETMWTDISGPEVEALIAGASGESLLVQVHRRRDDLTADRLFIDPALAVWHVGESAPRAYDELYLREQWNKGFVHVDPDRIAGGEPFVFTSGYERESNIIVSPAPPGGGGDVMQEWGVVRTSLQQRLVLPGAARLHGAFDSYWLTDVTLYNPLDTPQHVDVRFVAIGEEVAAAGGRTTRLTLQPHEIRTIPDALKALFDLENAGGALHFLPAAAINVTGRTYSRTANGGTFGFGMQAIDFFNAAGPRFPMTFAGAFPGEHFRTNLLLTDTSGRGTSADLNATGVSGAIGAANFSVTAPSSGITQVNGLRTPLSLLSKDDGGLVVQPTRGTAIPTLVAIDNRTNDPTYFPPDLPAVEARTIPVIGHLDGANGSRFRSDVYLLNPTSSLRTVVLEAKQWDSPARKTVQFTLLPREARVIPDALPTLFGMSGLARLRYDTNETGEGVRVTSRTYTEEASGATYGCLIPPLNNFQRGTPGDVLEILGINGGGNFRANLGLVELSPAGTNATALVRISIVDGAHKTLDSFPVNVPAAGGMQLNDIFHARGLTPPDSAIVFVQVVSGGIVGAYATLTDNLTNDSTYLATQKPFT